MIPPGSRLGPLTAEERRKLMQGSLVAGHYEKEVDRESAHEKLKARAGEKVAATPAAESGGLGGIFDKLGGGSATKGRTREGPVEAAAKSAARAIGSEVGRRIIRGVLGSILGGKR